MTHPTTRRPPSAVEPVRVVTRRTRTGPLARAAGRRLPRLSSVRGAFTLTEILIALAIVSLLLVGISRVFALTSATIGTGNALSGVLRTHKSLQQTFEADLLGLGTAQQQGGIMPIDGTSAGMTSQPMIIISNMRVAAFPTEEDQRADPDFQTLAGTALLDIAQRATKIRSIDDVGVTIPRYAYGDRNFRVDSFSFFSSGNFTRQTGNAMDPATATGSNPWSPEKGDLATELHTNEAWIWYGHLRLFNSNFANVERSIGYGAPGLAQTQGASNADGVNNRNNLYASQFTLGRMQILLKEPIDHDGNPNTLPTVVGDDGKIQSFAFRLNTNSSVNAWWIRPTDNIRLSTPIVNNLFPLEYGSDIRIFDASLGSNGAYHRNLATSSPLAAGTIETGRSDVAGVSAGVFRERLTAIYKAAETLHTSNNNTDKTNAQTWMDSWMANLFSRTTLRPWGNPYPAMRQNASGTTTGFSSREMSQRAMMLAAGCTNFIVEFAGDFGTQDPTTGAFTDLTPDGVTDFLFVNSTRQVRWYGMPRDVDEDGRIPGGNSAAVLNSPDVVPVRDALSNVLPAGTTRMPFEKSLPTMSSGGTDYLVDGNTATAADENASYLCAWGPQDFDGMYSSEPGAYYEEFAGNKYRPSMVRIITDLRDDSGKLKDFVRMENIFVIPLKK